MFGSESSAELYQNTLSSGARVVGALGRKEYGLQVGKKGAALKRAHADYLFAMGKRANVNIGAKMTGGEWVAKRVVSSADGKRHNVTFVTAESIGVATANPAEVAAKLSDAELLAILAARKPAAPAVPANQPTA
jgi:hypothetical protein